jgi:uncharacterized protein (DUF4415 family)
MKSANTGKPSRTDLAKLKKRSDSEIDVTDAPYNAHSAQDVNRFWENATLMPPRLRGQRGPQRAPTKQMVSMRLDRVVVDHFKADGPHWQTRVNDTLLRIVKKSIASTRRGVKVSVQRPIPASQRPKVARDAKTGALGRRLRSKGKPVMKRA